MTTPIGTLHLLKAEDLPSSTGQISDEMTVSACTALRIATSIPPTAPDHTFAETVERALAALAPPSQRASYTEEERRRLPEDHYEEYDEFFRAIRVSGNSVEEFTRTLLEACRAQMREAEASGVALAADDWHHLKRAFHTSCEQVLRYGADGAPVRRIPVAAPAPAEVAAGDPLLRWRVGHQVFFAMMQSLIVLLRCLIDQLRRAMRVSLGLVDAAADVMAGSAAAMRYAGDFAPRRYATTVRPAMLPPNLPPKFSGLQLRDHRVLLKALAEVKPLIAGAGDYAGPAYRRLLEQMRSAYAAHKLVCARFGGDREPSLRMSAGADSTALEVLDRLERTRLRSVSP